MTLIRRFDAALYAANIERATRSNSADDDAVAVEVLGDAYPSSSYCTLFGLFCDAVALAEDREVEVSTIAYAIVDGTL